MAVAASAVAATTQDVPWPTMEEFFRKVGDGQWESVSWIETQLQDRGFVDIKVNEVSKVISLSVPEMLQVFGMMVPMVAKLFWPEEQRQENLDKVLPALERYLIEIYGADGNVAEDWTAIVSTARKQ